MSDAEETRSVAGQARSMVEGVLDSILSGLVDNEPPEGVVSPTINLKVQNVGKASNKECALFQGPIATAGAGASVSMPPSMADALQGAGSVALKLVSMASDAHATGGDQNATLGTQARPPPDFTC